MPKTDLHLHLDGSIRLETLIDLAQQNNIELPSYTTQGLRDLVFKEKYNSLTDYLKGFTYTCSVLNSLESIERVAYELAIDNQNEGVYYIEVRFAPQLLMGLSQGYSMKDVLGAVNNGLKKAKIEFNSKNPVLDFDYGIINCAMRMVAPKGTSEYYDDFFKLHQYSNPREIMTQAALELAKGSVQLRNEEGIPIVAIDLAGQEEGFPAIHFKDAYQYAHKHFMHKTVHAGEAYGAESIFQAVTDLHAERIGHGYYLFDADKILDPKIKNKEKFIKNLSSYLADKRTTLEVCLTSNLQTNPMLKSIKDHPLKNMLARRVAFTLCTDNRLVSNTTVTKEFKLAVDNFDIPIKRLKDIVAYGFKKSFYPGDYVEKRAYAKKAMQYFDSVVKEFKLDQNK